MKFITNVFETESAMSIFLWDPVPSTHFNW